jgi:aldose 1-epimerase
MQERVFGTMPTGEAVAEYMLSNASRATVSVLSYGALLKGIAVPDRSGTLQDVVLGYGSLEEYLRDPAFLGRIVGRVAGRITRGTFTLDGSRYELEINNGPNHAHGGSEGLASRVWTAEEPAAFPGADELPPGDTVCLRYLSPHGESGYPGNLDVWVAYTLSEENELFIDYRGSSDRPTPFSPTNHAYFNLAGEGSGTIADHTITLFADAYTPMDDDLTLLGRVEPVEGRPNDFRSGRRMGDAIPEIFQSHGDNYVLRVGASQTNSVPEPVLAARVSESATGRTMDVSTNERCLQFYTGCFLDGSMTGTSGATYGRHDGFCLECQGYPDGVNHPEIADIVVRPAEMYRQRTVYRFRMG